MLYLAYAHDKGQGLDHGFPVVPHPIVQVFMVVFQHGQHAHHQERGHYQVISLTYFGFIAGARGHESLGLRDQAGGVYDHAS